MQEYGKIKKNYINKEILFSKAKTSAYFWQQFAQYIMKNILHWRLKTATEFIVELVLIYPHFSSRNWQSPEGMPPGTQGFKASTVNSCESSYCGSYKEILSILLRYIDSLVVLLDFSWFCFYLFVFLEESITILTNALLYSSQHSSTLLKPPLYMKI